MAGPDLVHLVAGEDVRYTLTGKALETWLPSLLAACDGRQSVETLVADAPAARRDDALSLVDRLYGERILVDGDAQAAHTPQARQLEVEGAGPLFERLRGHMGIATLPPLALLVQDRLDPEAALRFNERCLGGDRPWLWVSTGALARGYVSQVFLPGVGPCLGCLFEHFRRLTPTPELHDALREHARQGGAIPAVPFPTEGMGMLASIVDWKVAQLSLSEPSPALYRLHVLDATSLEVATHRVLADESCPWCGADAA